MLRNLIAFAVIAFASVAQAQDFAPPDKELWDAMTKAFGEISMPLPAHQRVQQILSDVQREASMRAMRAQKGVKPQPSE